MSIVSILRGLLGLGDRYVEPDAGVTREPALLIGPSAKQTAIRIISSPQRPALKLSGIATDSGPVSRLAPLIPAAISVLGAAEASGRHYMIVEISGKLARASDGNGWRGFSMGAKGIRELARLKDGALGQILTAGAAFQIVSMLVAQKHLADISRKLDEIKRAIDRISHFQVSQRKAAITAAYAYLRSVAPAVRAAGDEVVSQMSQQAAVKLLAEDVLKPALALCVEEGKIIEAYRVG